MHVAPADFRAVRRDGVLLRFAILDPVAYVLAEFPDGGSRGTFAEAPCDKPHWGVTVAGAVDLELDGKIHPIPPGTAFHVAAGVTHRFLIDGRARLAGFERLPADAPVTDAALRRAGFEPVRGLDGERPHVAIASPRPHVPPGEREVLATARRMGDLLFSRVALGRRAGYVALPCDLPHWGLVTRGSLAIEWEDSVEVLAAGDVFYCPPGPPGHRLQAAEPAVIVDFTPIEALETVSRVAEWRAEAARDALAGPVPPGGLEVAALV